MQRTAALGKIVVLTQYYSFDRAPFRKPTVGFAMRVPSCGKRHTCALSTCACVLMSYFINKFFRASHNRQITRMSMWKRMTPPGTGYSQKCIISYKIVLPLFRLFRNYNFLSLIFGTEFGLCDAAQLPPFRWAGLPLPRSASVETRKCIPQTGATLRYARDVHI